MGYYRGVPQWDSPFKQARHAAIIRRMRAKNARVIRIREAFKRRREEMGTAAFDYLEAAAAKRRGGGKKRV